MDSDSHHQNRENAHTKCCVPLVDWSAEAPTVSLYQQIEAAKRGKNRLTGLRLKKQKQPTKRELPCYS